MSYSPLQSHFVCPFVAFGTSARISKWVYIKHKPHKNFQETSIVLFTICVMIILNPVQFPGSSVSYLQNSRRYLCHTPLCRAILFVHFSLLVSQLVFQNEFILNTSAISLCKGEYPCQVSRNFINNRSLRQHLFALCRFLVSEHLHIYSTLKLQFLQLFGHLVSISFIEMTAKVIVLYFFLQVLHFSKLSGWSVLNAVRPSR